MDISSLQAPIAGRSRFSKALPTPPPGLDDRPRTALRELPDAPPAPLPPKKNSILITKPSIASLTPKSLDSPLPVLPIMAEPARPRLAAGPIARKPLAHLPTPPDVPRDTKTKAMKRKSSISSLLSAYSRSSSDWAASHESDFTKDSEPSYSPERERIDSPPRVPSKGMGTTNDANSDRASEVTSYTIIDSFPPPPLKNSSRPRTPNTSTAGPANGVQGREVDSASLSPISVKRSGSSQAGPEIWRRRASSKSDASLVIAELKLPGSNGSTASTSHIPVAKAELPSLPPPLPAKTGYQPALPLPSKHQQQSAATLPPRTISLPGRNIRPVKKTESVDDSDEMKKLMKFSKLKELVRGRGGDNDDDEKQKKSEQHELHETQKPSNLDSEASKPEPPAKDSRIQEPQQQQANAPTAAGVASLSTGLPLAPPQQASGMATTTGIPRRPVGEQPANTQSQAPRLELQFEKKETDLPNPQQASTQLASTHPRNRVGTLPHPSQRQQQQQQQPNRGPPVRPYPPSGPTSPTGGTPRSVSTSANAGQSAAAPAVATHGPPGSPRYQPQGSQPTSPNRSYSSPTRGNFSNQFLGQPRAPNLPSLTQSPIRGNERGAPAQMPGRAPDLSAYKDISAQPEQPMSDAAAAAVSLFPRSQNYKVERTLDGVLLSNPLADRHYNCHLKHTKFINSRNTHYPLTCQTCGLADKERRYLCSYCNLRICVPCVELLTANGRNLRATMAILEAQGRIKDWNQYPKQSNDGTQGAQAQPSDSQRISPPP